MKTSIISYSRTGNNEALADSLAAALGAEHFRITETGRRSMGTIVLDTIFKRTPAVRLPGADILQSDLVLFVGPVWMGQVASPFRACFRELRSRIEKYAFVSICGGADGPNPGLAGELCTRLDKEPAAVIDLHIADLLPPEPAPTRKTTMAYRVGESEIESLTAAAVAALRQRRAAI